MGGKRSREPASSKRLEKIAVQLFEQTDPLRRAMIQRSMDQLPAADAPFDPANTPQFRAFKTAAEPQFASSRNAILATLPQGGTLLDSLAGNEIDRARTLASAAGPIADQEMQRRENEINRALSLATGTSQQVIGGFSAAGNIQGQIANANASRDAAAKGAVGRGVGALLGRGK